MAAVPVGRFMHCSEHATLQGCEARRLLLAQAASVPDVARCQLRTRTQIVLSFLSVDHVSRARAVKLHAAWPLAPQRCAMRHCATRPSPLPHRVGGGMCAACHKNLGLKLRHASQLVQRCHCHLVVRMPADRLPMRVAAPSGHCLGVHAHRALAAADRNSNALLSCPVDMKDRFLA